MRLKIKTVWLCVLGFMFVGVEGCANDPSPQKINPLSEQVEVNWTWKRTVENSANFVYGTVKNKTDQKLKQVELEFRTQNKNGTTIQTHLFQIDNLEANSQKPFSQDYPAHSTQEDSGFVTVKKIIPMD
jgi:hypothetical protein